MRVKCTYNYHGTARQVFYDDVTGEIIQGNFPVQWKQDFCIPAIDTTNDVQTAVEGTSNDVSISADELNGTVIINTGTAADKRNVLTGELNWAAANECVCQIRFKTATSDAGILLFVGLSDSIDTGTGTLPLVDGSLVSGTIDSNTADLVGFGVRAETGDDIYAVSCLNDAAPQSTDTGLNLTLATWYTMTVVLDSLGNARYLINNVQYASHSLAVTASDLLCPFVGALITTDSTAALTHVDFLSCYQNRS